MAEPTDRLASLHATLSGYQFQFSSELELQEGVSQVLTSHEIEHDPEHLLDGLDRIDFLVGDLGLEIKVDGSLSLVTRQVHRYLQSDQVKGLLLLTSRQKHRNLPSTINGKPVRVLWATPL